MKGKAKKIIHLICYSGGHSSAICAIEAKRRFGKENVILVNHDINPRFENADIKRFKKEVSDYLGIPITYVNYKGITNPEEIPSQFDVCLKRGSWVSPQTRDILCTYLLKTEPFHNFIDQLKNEYDIVAYYGFDENELSRVERRKTILNDIGVDSDFPIALWGEGKMSLLEKYFEEKGCKKVVIDIEGFENRDDFQRTIYSTEEIGIKPPNTYSVWKHANCTGCLKAGKQHWYCVYVHDYEVFCMGRDAEIELGYSFGKEFLRDLEDQFKKMKELGVPANENIPSHVFWKSAKKYLKQETLDLFPCQCFI